MTIRLPIPAIALLVLFATAAETQQVKPSRPTVTLLENPMDPFGYPRPPHGAKGVPVRTSLYFEMGVEQPKPNDRISTPTLSVTLQAAGRKPVQVLSPGGRFERGFNGTIKEFLSDKGKPTVGVYIEPVEAMEPLTTYTVRVAADSLQKAARESGPTKDHWSFTTATKAEKQRLAFDLDLTARSVHWQGAFFSGLCNVAFCNIPNGLEPSYAMMARDRQKYPKAWAMQRDLWLTGFEDGDPNTDPWSFQLPCIVRELETRRIAAITTVTDGFLLKVEDFLGHEQYGIPTGRALSEDYRKGYEILIADGNNHVRATVVKVDDKASTVLVGRFEMPAGGFKINDPSKKISLAKVPGVFPVGGCYLRRFAPLGTPRYYWGRLDAAWDIVVKRYGVRPIVNFCDAPGDISAMGKNWSPPKDFVQLHEVIRTMTNHIIDRYGAEASLTFFWSIFNEPDLRGIFWLGTSEELYQYYDYATDAILRAFEDHGLDSSKVFIGGLELAAPFPNLSGLEEFLRHGSPNGATAVSLNAAYADKRLDGKRSRRVESLCRVHGGKGSPVDFISVHIYRSSAMASMLTLAKTKALSIDPEYYAKLWACSHETCPAWAPPYADVSSTDVYFGNGYYPSWCADYMWRQLSQGAKDARYAMGNTVLTYFPWPSIFGFGKTCGATQMVQVDDSGDGKSDREATIPMPIYPFLNLLGSLGDDYWVLPERIANGHTVAGFASRGTGGELRVLLYAHDPADLQGRAGQEFEIELSVAGLSGSASRVEQYRFDRNHHSYYELAKKIQARSKETVLSADELRKLEEQVALKAETTRTIWPGEGGKLRVSAALAGNGATFLVIQSEK